MNYFIIFSLLLSFTAIAQKAELLVIDEDIDASALEDHYNVKKGSTLKSFLPPKEQRDSFLALVPETKEWDEYQKDVFYMDFKNKSETDIQKRYPHFSIDQIKKLKSKL